MNHNKNLDLSFGASEEYELIFKEYQNLLKKTWI